MTKSKTLPRKNCISPSIAQKLFVESVLIARRKCYFMPVILQNLPKLKLFGGIQNAKISDLLDRCVVRNINKSIV